MLPLLLLALMSDPFLQRALDLHKRIIVVDTHADTTQRMLDENMELGKRQPDGHLDIPRMREGGLGAEFFSIWVEPKNAPDYLMRALRQIDAVYREVERNPAQIEMAYTTADIRRLHQAGKIAALMGLEGGDAIQDDLAVLDMLHRLGIRYMTLTWAYNNNWADSSTDKPRHNGLSPFGKQVVERMNRLGMMVDISHVADKTFYDVLGVSKVPVIASHSSCRAITNVPRNMTDEMIRDLAKHGGVMQINFHEGFLDQAYADARVPMKEEMDREEARIEQQFKNDPAQLAREKRKWEAATEARLPRPDVQRIADHIDHVRKLVGVDYIGVGSDFDGARMPRGMEGVDHLPALTAELLRRGYSEQDLKKILGGNLLRVMEQVEKAAKK
jgi:membrane dipeptidase